MGGGGEVMVALNVHEQEKVEAQTEWDRHRHGGKCGRTSGDARVMDKREAPLLTRVWRGRV